MVDTLPGTNQRVVIECDGHPFHKDVVRDRVRDSFMKESGFMVVHIPARVALGYGEDPAGFVKTKIK